MISRRDLVIKGATIAAAGCATLSSALRAHAFKASTEWSVSEISVWEAWKYSFLQSDGRVIDTLQHGASHSEGQGYGAFLASAFGDKITFDRIFNWTEQNLAIRSDGLLAWRFLPGEINPVLDHNNASDGDLFYAWALVRAARRFNDRSYMLRATEIAQALVDHCVLPNPAVSGETLLIPGVVGFSMEDRVVFNPSYVMPRGMREVAEATGVFQLSLAALHSENFLVRLSEAGPVPDWIQITPAGFGPATNLSSVAGYDAMRVPLYLIWSGLKSHPAVLQMVRVYAQLLKPGRPVPTRIDPASGVVIEASNDPGYRAIAALVSCVGNYGQSGSEMPSFDGDQPYYPATLHLLAMIAVNEVTPECIPI